MTVPIATVPDITIRTAVLDDDATLARFAESSFRDTFERFNRAEDMAQYVASVFRPELQRAELDDSRGVVLIAETRTGIVGYAQLLRGEAPPGVEAAAIELQRFYVAREHHGSGLAVRLMKDAFAVAADRGASAIWLGVWEHNARAIAFYAKYGFVDIGTKTFMLGSDLQTDRVMWRPTGS